MKEETQNSGPQTWSSTSGVQVGKSVLLIQPQGILVFRLVWGWSCAKKNNSSQPCQAELRIQIWFKWLSSNLKKKYQSLNFKKFIKIFYKATNIKIKCRYILPHKLQVFTEFVYLSSPLRCSFLFLFHPKFSSRCYKILLYGFIQNVT